MTTLQEFRSIDQTRLLSAIDDACSRYATEHGLHPNTVFLTEAQYEALIAPTERVDPVYRLWREAFVYGRAGWVRCVEMRWKNSPERKYSVVVALMAPYEEADA